MSPITERFNRRSTINLSHRSTSTSLIPSETTQDRCSTTECTQKPISPSETPIDNISEQFEDAAEPMQVNQATMGRALRKRKEKVLKASEERS
ncbi:hypothetical protein F2Q70_00005548 [Brassica cretica]|uniref:Uncharacterized protein n=1 Tax=Brassica cretica TaxID=69181 RepID=A0A3N6QRA6_BRACR|nr:hypothetical protein F2Q70_00005548 [Brassica cretica]KAF3562150.1 hypothetical protein DY000_02012637 [Brassica cretica]